MGELVLPKEGIQKAFSQADQLVGQSVRAIATMVNQPGIVRVSLADLTMALRSPNSRCLFGFGEARGANRVPEALKRALKSPLVNQGLLLQNAQNLIVHIAGGESITLAEVDMLMKQLGKHVPDETQIMFGVTVEPKLTDLLTVTLMSSLSATDMALESLRLACDRQRADARTPGRTSAARREARERRTRAQAGAGFSRYGNGTHAPARPAPASQSAQPELPAMEAAAPILENFHEVTIEELFAAEPPQAEVPKAERCLSRRPSRQRRLRPLICGSPPPWRRRPQRLSLSLLPRHPSSPRPRLPRVNRLPNPIPRRPRIRRLSWPLPFPPSLLPSAFSRRPSSRPPSFP